MEGRSKKKMRGIKRKIIEFKKDFTITVPIIYNLREKAQFTVFFFNFCFFVLEWLIDFFFSILGKRYLCSKMAFFLDNKTYFKGIFNYEKCMLKIAK